MTTVFIAGCFDGLHSAHLSILQRARALGDRLIVGLNSDVHLARKGPGRPIDRWGTRAEKLNDTGLVASVYWIDDSPLAAILSLKPDIIAVGSDYTMDTTVGAKECAQWGGKVIILPRTPGISTTEIVNELAHETKESEDADESAANWDRAWQQDNESLEEGQV